LLFTPEGPVPAAGIPWFVAAFGRDALLTAYFLLPYRPDVAAGTLRYLARWQARDDDPERESQPGKIMHELRFGELTRTRKTPHSPYYGSVDATPLFLMLLDGYVRATGDDSLLTELRPAWQAGLEWLTERGDVDGDGFFEFGADAEGTGHLSVQSWKDSHDSMSHHSGELATGPLAVSEVQGYAYAAYAAASGWLRRLGEPGRADEWAERAERLRTAFDAAFWLDDLGTYAMALDGAKRPLGVLNSDAGQLLWTGIVPDARAPRLVATLLSEPSWSGWGLRTLGAGEARYNPVSYHNGSVWPHDTALFAAGLAAYGFADQSAAVRSALFDLASCQPDLRLPELVAGYARDGRPPVPYPVACRPQAWDAAALVYLASLET
jgi:glycogen debranching enzyme